MKVSVLKSTHYPSATDRASGSTWKEVIKALSRTASFSLYQPFTFAYRFQYRALKAEEVDAAHQKVLEALTQKLGVKFR